MWKWQSTKCNFRNGIFFIQREMSRVWYTVIHMQAGALARQANKQLKQIGLNMLLWVFEFRWRIWVIDFLADSAERNGTRRSISLPLQLFSFVQRRTFYLSDSESKPISPHQAILLHFLSSLLFQKFSPSALRPFLCYIFIFFQLDIFPSLRWIRVISLFNWQWLDLDGVLFGSRCQSNNSIMVSYNSQLPHICAITILYVCGCGCGCMCVCVHSCVNCFDSISSTEVHFIYDILWLFALKHVAQHPIRPIDEVAHTAIRSNVNRI